MLLEIKELTKNFGGLSAVNDLNFSIEQGEFVGLIGPNGSGKTTTFNVIAGYYRPTKGMVVFTGKNVAGKKPNYIAARGIIRTFQANSVFQEFSVLQNIIAACHLQTKMGFFEGILHLPSSHKKEANSLYRALEIIRFTGLDNVRDTTAKKLPHKHKRILGIAIALAAEPKLLLLDEPLSGMNSEEVAEVSQLILNIWQKGTTVLLIEHNMRAAMSLCQRLVVINFGKKIAEGPPQEIQENPQVIQAYLGASKNVT